VRCIAMLYGASPSLAVSASRLASRVSLRPFSIPLLFSPSLSPLPSLSSHLIAPISLTTIHPPPLASLSNIPRILSLDDPRCLRDRLQHL
jgi:hypothetical protein